MTIEPIGVVALILGLIGLCLEPPFLIYVFFGSTLLGAAAALVLTSLGGATIQPAHLLLGILAVKLLSRRDVRAAVLNATTFGNPGFWLVITVGYAVLSAYLLPRLFMGQTLVFPVRADDYHATSLAPSTSNLTQSVYFIGDCICFLMFYGLGSSESGRKSLCNAALMCVVLNLVFAALDLVTFATGTTELLSFIRNSTYSILNEHEVAGFKRIVGSFVEASSFGFYTLGYFAFALSLWFNGIKPRFTAWLSALSFVALMASTSTTGYFGLTVFIFAQLCFLGLKLLAMPISWRRMAFLIGVPFVGVLVILAIAMNDEAFAYISDLLNQTVLNKMSTSSGIERSSWNNQAIQNFIDTFGFGVGNGSVRASSFPVAVIASLGFPGAMAYAAFLLSALLGRSKEASQEVHTTRVAARSACFAWLIAATASAGVVDLGLAFFSFAAVACLNPFVASARPFVGLVTHVERLES
jgi:hypothetical protein